MDIPALEGQGGGGGLQESRGHDELPTPSGPSEYGDETSAPPPTEPTSEEERETFVEQLQKKKIRKSDEQLESADLGRIEETIREARGTLTLPPTTQLAMDIAALLADETSTEDLMICMEDHFAGLVATHVDYALLAGRLAVARIRKKTSPTFMGATHKLVQAGRLNRGYVEFCERHAEKIEAAVNPTADRKYDILGMRTLMYTYLSKIDEQLIERPQYMWMRCAIGMYVPRESQPRVEELSSGSEDSHYAQERLNRIQQQNEEDADQIHNVLTAYRSMSLGYYTHATPTIANAGMKHNQMASCFLLPMAGDSIEEVMLTLSTIAIISKHSGGIGISVSMMRAANSAVATTGGRAAGIVPLIRVINNLIRYVDQGGRRKGALAVYLEPWHADILDFLDLRRPHGHEDLRARDIFLGAWIPDEFMRRVKLNLPWSLFCPNEILETLTKEGRTPLQECYGEEFEKNYRRLEELGLARKTIPARDIWNKMLESQIETGLPYICYKDAVNRKTNQMNLGTTSLTNLCTEVTQFSSGGAQGETAVCQLASIAVHRFAVIENEEVTNYNFGALRECVHELVGNLNSILDVNYYPTSGAETSAERHRAIGIGIQGLSDLFQMCGYEYESEEAADLDEEILANIYYAAVEKSMLLAQIHGPYSTFEGSPASQGKLQPDLWGVQPMPIAGVPDAWDRLRADVKKHGMRNSLVTALMPTASTAQLNGNSESTEPPMSNLHVRHLLSGLFIVANKYLAKELETTGLWNEALKQELVGSEGSIRKVKGIKREVRRRYKTAWELNMKTVIKRAARRGIYVDQAQSLNLFVRDATIDQLSELHQYAHSLGLKTTYYLRTTAACEAVKITVNAPQVNGGENGSTNDHDTDNSTSRTSGYLTRGGSASSCMDGNPSCASCEG
jgi:ribonucleoside-diphosphate reductase alpha subunit